MSRPKDAYSDEYELLDPSPSPDWRRSGTNPPSVPSVPSFHPRAYSYSSSYFNHDYDISATGKRPVSALNGATFPHEQHGESRYWSSLFAFIRKNRLILIALVLGIAGSFASFGFTYWLSHQTFECPSWAFRCGVKASVHWFVERLGFVQGFLSSLYGISIACIAYATYQVAETTIWPMLTEQPLTLQAIDRYLAHARGSLPSFPLALWHARRSKHLITVLLVGLVGVLLQASATIVGYAFTVSQVPTALQSKHTIGGGMGFGFSQSSPPGPRAGAPGVALALYAGWSGGQVGEALPDLREYLIDRQNLSSIGNFTVRALHAKKMVDCYPEDLNIATKPDGKYATFTVNGNLGDEVLLRFLPNQLTVWVDNIREVTDTKAVTKLMFAITNGTIENGANNQMSDLTNSICMDGGQDGPYGGLPCAGISSIACDISIDLLESEACNGECHATSSKALSDLNNTYVGDLSRVAMSAYLGAIPTMLGEYIYGAQPCYSFGSAFMSNSTTTLPAPFTDVWVPPGGLDHWTLAKLTDFVNVSSGALAIAAMGPTNWPRGETPVDSMLHMPRMTPERSYSLLAPPAIALLCLLAVVILSSSVHRSADVTGVRLGSTSEILIHCADADVKSLVDSIRAGHTKAEVLEQKLFWFGQLRDGRPGLGPSVRTFIDSQRPSRAVSQQDVPLARSFL